ncbi:hypothetical protein BGX31_006791, partial [Mortierella sp. GBA43]
LNNMIDAELPTFVSPFAGFFTLQIEKAEIAIHPTPASHSSRARSRQELDNLEELLSEHENRLLQMNNSYENMQRRYLELIEQKHVLVETKEFFRFRQASGAKQ